MPRFLSLLLVFAVVACAPRRDRSPVRTGDEEWQIDLPQSERLREDDVETSEDGPWTIRRTVSERRARGAGSPAEGKLSAPAKAVAKADSPEATIEEHEEMDSAFEAEPSPDPASSARMPSPVPGSDGGGAPLRAGSTDDNEKFDEFLEFLARWSDRQDTVGNFELLDVRGRRYVRVVTEDGRPLPAAQVTVVDERADRVLLRGTTYGDGRVPFYPRLTKRTEGDLIVRASLGGESTQVRWTAEEDLSVTLDIAAPAREPILLDVLFAIDTTGSMGDEIRRIKTSLLGVTKKLRSLEREFDLRYAAVLYRDLGDEYVTKAHPFTGDIAAFDSALQSIRAAGGGDGPESLNQGMAEAVGRADWRAGAAKVMFLIADAPPHMDYEGDVAYGESLKAAVGKGIRIHSVAASGISPVGSLVFRQIAQFTRGKFIFIEYGGDIGASGAAHGVKGAKKSNNLDDILFTQIRDEVARWGRAE